MRKALLSLILLLAAPATSTASLPAPSPRPDFPPSALFSLRQLVVCTVDGAMHSIDIGTGSVRWSLDLPASDSLFTSSAGPGTSPPATSADSAESDESTSPQLVPSIDGGLYAYAPGGATAVVRRLPVTVPEIVSRSPFTGPDGVLYLGDRQATVYSVDGVRGEVRAVLAQGTAFAATRASASAPPGEFRIGRVDYVVKAVDPDSASELWNVTLVSFVQLQNRDARASGASLGGSLVASPDGRIALIDGAAGDVSWRSSLPSPAISAYVLTSDMRLERVPITYGHLKGSTVSPIKGVHVGSFKGQFFAFPSQPISGLAALPSPGDPQQQQLLDPWGFGTGSQIPSLPPSRPSLIEQLRSSWGASLVAFSGVFSGILISVGSWIVAKKRYQSVVPPIPAADAKEAEQRTTPQPIPPPLPPPPAVNPPPEPAPASAPAPSPAAAAAPVTVSPPEPQPVPVSSPPVFPSRPPEVKATVTTPLPEVVAEPPREAPKKKKPKKKPAQPQPAPHITVAPVATQPVATEPPAPSPPALAPAPVAPVSSPSRPGVTRVGKLEVFTTKVLGRGSVGTIVYEGSFDGRRVAVKRLLKEFYDFAKREISLLLESDEHPNLVRYYATEEDSDFVYLALTYCDGTLSDWVERQCKDAGVEPGTGFEARITPELVRLMSDIAAGVFHIHSLNIVHRDLKPQNILIDTRRRARISDMGLAKKFEGTHFSYSIGNAGSAGWMAPEILVLRSGKPAAAGAVASMTRAMDIFALGCIFYYMATGVHPFGDRLERDSNIAAGRSDMSGLWTQPELLDLIEGMTRHEPEKRLTAHEVRNHPFFWDASRRLQFMLAASDRLEVEKPSASIVAKFEAAATSKARISAWDRRLDVVLLDDLTHHRKYNFDAARDLLRVLRNKANHYYDLPQNVRQLLGSLPDGFVEYFDSRFPSLLVVTYEFLLSFCHDEPVFAMFFPQ